MEVKAKAKFIKMSPKKVRLVIDVVRGMDVNDAIDQLSFLHKAASSPVRKLLDSAIANAEHNFSLSRSNLYIKEVRADEGPKIKRWAPKAFGRAGMIRKRSTHISLLLGERVPTKQKRTAKTTSQEARKGDVKEVSQKPVEALEKAKTTGQWRHSHPFRVRHQ